MVSHRPFPDQSATVNTLPWRHLGPAPLYGCLSLEVNHQPLPLLDTEAHITIVSGSFKTLLKQTFGNSSLANDDKEWFYRFPLHGVSVVTCKCNIGSKSAPGFVREDENAEPMPTTAQHSETPRQDFKASDVFRMKIGKVPAGETVFIETTYTGETKLVDSNHHTFTIPAFITPQHDLSTLVESDAMLNHDLKNGVRITVDITMATGQTIKRLESPSHPITSSIRTTSSASQALAPLANKGLAALSLETSSLGGAFVLNIITDTSPDDEEIQMTSSSNQATKNSATQSSLPEGADPTGRLIEGRERGPVALLPISPRPNYVPIARPSGSSTLPIHGPGMKDNRTYMAGASFARGSNNSTDVGASNSATSSPKEELDL